MADALGYLGRLAVTVAGQAGDARVTRLSSQGSWRVVEPVHAARYPGPELRIVSQTPGLAGGDRQIARLAVGPGGWCRIQPVAAEVVLPGRGRRARQWMAVSVREGGRLYWGQEPLIPHPGARLDRHVALVAGAGAVLAVEEFVMVGRVARGERLADIDMFLAAHARFPGGHFRDVLAIGPPLAAGWGNAEGYWTLITIGADWSRDIRDVAGPAYSGVNRLAAGAGFVVRALGSYSQLTVYRDAVRRIMMERMFGTSNNP